jgi:hypothetical protein
MMMGVKIMCFLPWKKKSKLRKIFGFELILGFQSIFVFLENIDWFNKVSRVSLGCFGSKWVENEFLDQNKIKTCFSGHASG